MTQQNVLVTGGAGYIGSHVVLQLQAAGYGVVVLDNLSTGFRQAVLNTPLILGDTGDMNLIKQVLEKHQIDAVMHFAAHTIVPESVANPLKYYGNNTCQSRSLLQCCVEYGVKHFIFSSTAAVYGIPQQIPATEDSPLAPINAYGSSKLMTEWMLRDVAQSSGLTYISLRYFNVAGCDPLGRIGQSTPNATLLIKVACEAAVGKRDGINIFGTDYATPDGTCIRDYIHVDDLASAHLKALDYLQNGGDSTIFNCGYGHGFSVREVLDVVQRVNGAAFPCRELPRRAGDPPLLISAADKIKKILGWQPRYDDLETIVKTSLQWEKKLKQLGAYN